jgi:hypothetical protein
MSASSLSSQFAGIDVSKDGLDAAVSSSGTVRRFPNSQEGVDQLIAFLGEQPPALAVLEATGGYEMVAALALSVAGIPVAIVNPRQVRDFAKATGVLAKTDAIDARVLASFAERVRSEPRLLADEQQRDLLNLPRVVANSSACSWPRTTASPRPAPRSSARASRPTSSSSKNNSGAWKKRSEAPSGTAAVAREGRVAAKRAGRWTGRIEDPCSPNFPSWARWGVARSRHSPDWLPTTTTAGVSAAERQSAADAPRCEALFTWPRSSPRGTMPPSESFTSGCWRREKPRSLPSPPSPENSSSPSTRSSETKPHGAPRHSHRKWPSMGLDSKTVAVPGFPRNE